MPPESLLHHLQVGAIAQGEVVLYDSAIYHAGGANVGMGRRSLLSLSFINPGTATATAASSSDMRSEHTRPEIQGRFSLADFLVD